MLAMREKNEERGVDFYITKVVDVDSTLDLEFYMRTGEERFLFTAHVEIDFYGMRQQKILQFKSYFEFSDFLKKHSRRAENG